ncbi:MAG: hypothetical protein JNM74_17970 [Myxococcales bacterium]|nr:hypothetical protein [Myxococcales bacterium]
MSRYLSRALGLLTFFVLAGCASTEGPREGTSAGTNGEAGAPSSTDARATISTGVALATDGCRPIDEVTALSKTDPSDTFVLARVTPKLGCLGGKWIVGETLEASPRNVFVGASSATDCPLWGDAPPKNATYAVVRQRQTAAVFHANDPCLTEDGGRPLTTDRSTLGLVLYADEASARAAFVAARAQ